MTEPLTPEEEAELRAAIEPPHVAFSEDLVRGLFASLDAARRERDEARNDSQGMVDAVIYYRNLAISYGAKPEQMRGASDKKLCESGDFEFDDPHSFSLRDSVEEQEAMWSAVSERDLARAELAKSEAACAEMRAVLSESYKGMDKEDGLPCWCPSPTWRFAETENEGAHATHGRFGPGTDCQGTRHALSTDAGRGWLSPSDVVKVQEVLADVFHCGLTDKGIHADVHEVLALLKGTP